MTSPRQELVLDADWLFHLGDIDSPVPRDKHIAAYMANKAGWARGAARVNYDDSDWRVVNLPHDWSVEGTFDQANFLDNGFLPRGIGWYRKHLRLDESDRGKYLALRFDGVSSHCTVFVNGHVLHRNFCGYTSFTVDISDVATFGDDAVNVIAVRVDATPIEGWWYEGAGIYRHTWLIKASPVHFATNGAFVNPVKLDATLWSTRVDITIENTSDSTQTYELYAEFRGISDHAYLGEIEVPARSSIAIDESFPTLDPPLWSCEKPILREIRFLIRDVSGRPGHSEGRVIDDAVVQFG